MTSFQLVNNFFLPYGAKRSTLEKAKGKASARTERPSSQHFQISKPEKHHHQTLSQRGLSISGVTKMSPSLGIAQSLKEGQNNSIKNSGEVDSFRIKLHPGADEDQKIKLDQVVGQNSNKKKNAAHSKVSAEEEVAQNLMERIKRKIKAMNMLIQGIVL